MPDNKQPAPGYVRFQTPAGPVDVATAWQIPLLEELKERRKDKALFVFDSMGGLNAKPPQFTKYKKRHLNELLPIQGGVIVDQLLKDFMEIRRVSTPWCCIRTPDPMNTIVKLLTVRDQNGEKPKAGYWTCVDGVQSPVRLNTGEAISDTYNDFASEDDAPNVMLKKALKEMPQGSILFIILPDNSFFESPFNSQAIANLRDEFKANNRTLVILGINPRPSEFLAEDIPILDDPLPTLESLEEIAQGVATSAEKNLTKEEAQRAASLCLGMTRFAAEEAFARKLALKSTINAWKAKNKPITAFDYEELSRVKQNVIEAATNKALTFDKEIWSFNQMGGLDAFKGFMTDIFKGPNKPTLVVRVDEIDKSISSASTGQVADNTGVSQDILKVLLTALEDNSWLGLLAVGAPGTGKTLASVCTGNEFGVKTLSLDLGAVKGSLVGESEGKIRRVIDVIKTIGGKNVLFMATANRLDTMPPELQRRFWLGTWFWDLPSQEELKTIWSIQGERYKLDTSNGMKPDDTDWTGSDVRNCCRMAYTCSSSLKEASERISIVSKVNSTQIEALRTLAEKSGFRSANNVGCYKRPVSKSTVRKIGRDM